MSWDLFAQDFPDVAGVAEVPDDFDPAPLGARQEIIDRIKAAIPSADFSDPSWGMVEQDGWSIEINLGEESNCDGFALHVRGSGDAAMDQVAIILDATGARAIDAQTGEFFSRAAATDSFGAWQAYRDQIGVRPDENKAKSKPGFFARLFGG